MNTVTVRPGALVHRGSIEASAFVFDAPLIGEAAARARVLAMWNKGARVYRLPNGKLLLRLPSAVRTSTALAPGLPLVDVGGVLIAAPLTLEELKAINPPRDGVVLVEGSKATSVMLTAEMLEQPAHWLDVEAFTVVQVRSLGAPPPPARLVAEEKTFDPRANLHGVPDAAPELAKVIDALRKTDKQKHGATSTRTQSEELPEWLARTADGIVGAVKSVPQFLRGLVQRNDATSAATTQVTSTTSSRFSAQWRRVAARFLIQTRLASVIGRRQAQYLGRMMEMFESGDLQNALRHAIPLGSLPEDNSPAPSFGVPRARRNLDLTLGATSAGTSIGLMSEVFNELQLMYRRAFERLQDQGRIEEAAFVLAELLQANEEAVAFLERHNRKQLAAEMAEARQLAPGLVVRQWFVAGNRERAVWYARTHEAFADAVVRLEKDDAEQAKVLRLLWAKSLAVAGDYAGAVEAIWSVAEARHLALEWMNRTIEVGGVAAARMLARKLVLVPAEFQSVREQVIDLLQDETIDSALSRQEFAEAVRRGERTPASKALARVAARSLVRDAGLGFTHLTSNELKKLAEFADDGALRTDLPLLPQVAKENLRARVEPLELTFNLTDAGTVPVHDVALLPNNRYVVALGEAGARVCTKNGRTVTHFDQPAYQLVMSDRGDRAIAIAPRGQVSRLAQLDFLMRRATEWCEAEINNFATSYDGGLWFVSSPHNAHNRSDDLLAIDVTAQRWDAFWRVPDLASVVAIARSSAYCSLVTATRKSENEIQCERWLYELPGFKLRARVDVPVDPHLMTISAGGSIVAFTHAANQDSPEAPNLYLHTLRTNAVAGSLTLLEQGNSSPLRLVANEDWIIAAVRTIDEVCLYVIDERETKVRAKMKLHGATDVCARLNKNTLIVGDTRGRVVSLDLSTGRVLSSRVT